MKMRDTSICYIPSVRQKYSLQNVAARCVKTKEFWPREMQNLSSIEPRLRSVLTVVFDAISK